jgi:hypothetical protein
MAGLPYMNTTRSAWYAYSLPNSTVLRCACCANEIDLQFPTADHHPRVCPACGIACAFLNWQSRIIQIVTSDAPHPLAEVIHWAQKHLDELEYVELLCALEEMAEAMRGEPVAIPPMKRSPS